MKRKSIIKYFLEIETSVYVQFMIIYALLIIKVGEVNIIIEWFLYDFSSFFSLLQLDEYKICSTGLIFLFSPSCSFYHLFDSTVFSLSLAFSFQHLVPFWNKKKYYYYSASPFITSLIPFFSQF
jgi:hypothetical protein